MISLFSRSRGLVDQILRQCARGKVLNARPSALASSISGPIFGNRAAIWSRTWSQVVAIASARGWAKIVRNTAATISTCPLGTGEQVAGEVDAAPLV